MGEILRTTELAAELAEIAETKIVFCVLGVLRG
jgi:hypothetical protein